MKHTDHILVALDLSDVDDKLLEYAGFFANRIGAKEVTGIHIVPVILLFDTIKIEVGHFLNPVAPALGKIQEELEEKAKAKLEGKGFAYSIDLIEGRPYQELITRLTDSPAQLLILGKKEHSSSSGITAKRTARHTKCDLLLVPDKCLPEINHVMVAMDFSENAERAFEKSLELVAKLGPETKLECLHIIDQPSNLSSKDWEKLGDLDSDLPEELNTRLNRLKQKYPDISENIEYTFLKSGQHNIAKTIQSYASNSGADLLVLGAIGHNLLENFLFGSVAEGMVDHYFEQPIYIVR